MNICVYGAASKDIDAVFTDAGHELGFKLAKRGHALVFGGGDNGMMGAAARGAHDGGGHITGIAPSFFNIDGVLYPLCDEFVYPDSMRKNKKYMEDNADAFIVTPGGIGTYEEFFEVLTLKQLARMSKPIAVFNVNGFYDSLYRLILDNTENGFIRKPTTELFRMCATVEEAVDCVENDAYDINNIRFTD